MVALVEDADARSDLARFAHPDFEASADPEQPGLGETKARGTMTGIDAFLSGWQDWLSAFESYWLIPKEFVALPNDRVWILVENRAVSKTGGVEMAFDGGAICTIKKGQIRRLDLFLDPKRSLEAAGLSDSGS